MAEKLFRVLSLDGGGAKGFYTLGVLREIEALIGCPIHKRFDLVFGTSTGSIIGALLALGTSVPDILGIYEEHVPAVMKETAPNGKSLALAELSKKIFGEDKFEKVKTNIGIVATRWVEEHPMIFKSNIAQAHGMKATFAPGFGVTIGDAVQASCSAFPFFNRKVVITEKKERVELIDGGFCANNPTLYAIADATIAMKIPPENIRVVSLGVGTYPAKPISKLTIDYWKRKTPGVQLLQKTLEINTQSMDQLRTILYKHIQTVRISQTFSEPTMATDLFEYDLEKLNILMQRGAKSYAEKEEVLKSFLL